MPLLILNSKRKSSGFAVGGTEILEISGYRIHIFKASGILTVEKETEVEYLVIAGGGGSYVLGSGRHTFGRSGAGAGGYRSSVEGEISGQNSLVEEKRFLIPGNYSVTVGAGGVRGIVSGITTASHPTNGHDSSFLDIISVGGGKDGTLGGSGGGGFVARDYGSGASGTPNQGFSGGTSHPGYGSVGIGGGGGGAGSPGENAVSTKGGNGGAGIVSNITGNLVERAGGGAGGKGYATGGGGNGCLSAEGVGENGQINTGGGAGGGTCSGGCSLHGSSGGSGIVIIRYAI